MKLKFGIVFDSWAAANWRLVGRDQTSSVTHRCQRHEVKPSLGLFVKKPLSRRTSCIYSWVNRPFVINNTLLSISSYLNSFEGNVCCSPNVFHSWLCIFNDIKCAPLWLKVSKCLDSYSLRANWFEGSARHQLTTIRLTTMYGNLFFTALITQFKQAIIVCKYIFINGNQWMPRESVYFN